MTQSARKFVGTWLIIGLVIAYPLGIAVLYTEWLGWLPIWASLIFFLIVGLCWAIPAGMIIKWMAKPDAEQSPTE